MAPSDEILPPLRAAEADARTALERQRVAAEQLAAEEARAKAAIGAAIQRLEQAKRDLDRARGLMRDAAEAERRLAAEDATLAAAEAGNGRAARRGCRIGNDRRRPKRRVRRRRHRSRQWSAMPPWPRRARL